MTKHILIAEDDAALADMMSKVLRKYNVRVSIAYNGQETIEILEKEEPDLLLLDILMPVLDGHEVLKFMKEKELDCPIIVITNLSDKKTMTKCKEMNVKKYIVKNDMDDDDLWPAIEKFLHG